MTRFHCTHVQLIHTYVHRPLLSFSTKTRSPVWTERSGDQDLPVDLRHFFPESLRVGDILLRLAYWMQEITRHVDGCRQASGPRQLLLTNEKKVASGIFLSFQVHRKARLH